MKKFLVGVLLFSISPMAHAVEHRFIAIERFGVAVPWNSKQTKLPKVTTGAPQGGTLSIAKLKPIESLHPYDFEQGRFKNRASLIDSLLYESLMLPDPVAKSERMYPLIAKSVRIPDDLSYVVFELEPTARFQDGTFVRGEDVLYSAEQLKNSSTELKNQFEAAVKSVQVSPLEVKFELKTSGQASRHAIMWLASLKIVKPNTTGSTVVGGIAVNYTATGPYRLMLLGRNRLSVIKDPAYWGANLAVRNGFFHLRQIDVMAFQDENSARMSLAGEKSNFLLENQLGIVASLNEQLAKANSRVQMIEETAGRYMQNKPALLFNISRPTVQNMRVRQALLMAYDFEGMNQAYHSGNLRRASHLADSSDFQPIAIPSADVRAIMNTCTLPDEAVGDFSSFGHAAYNQITDKRLRLLTAQKLLLDAGFKIENGTMKRPLSDGSLIPVTLKVAAQDADLRSLQLYKADLSRLGITLTIINAQAGNSDYDLISATEEFLTADGWPSVQNFKLIESQRLPCINKMIEDLRNEAPYSELFRNTVDALARVTQALSLNIYTGEPKTKSFFVDNRLHIPEGLSWDNGFMYAYWFDRDVPTQNIYTPPPSAGCQDISCVFGHR